MNGLQKWLLKLSGHKPPENPLVPVLRDASTVRLSEWRSKDSLVAAAHQLAANKTYQFQMAVLQSENPCHTVLALGVSPNDRIVHQARIEGYEMALNNLEAFAKPMKLPERLEAVYEPTETVNQRRK